METEEKTWYTETDHAGNGGIRLTGAILGDIAGSRFEFSKPSGFNYKKVELFVSEMDFKSEKHQLLNRRFCII